MTPNPLAKRVITLRKERGWSQEQLAAVAQISVRTIQRLEVGNPVSLDTLVTLAAVLDVDVSVLNAPEPEDDLPQDVCLMNLVSNGTQVVRLVLATDAWRFEHDHLHKPEAARLVGEFFDLVRDWGELSSEIEPSHRLSITLQFSAALEALKSVNVLVFAAEQSAAFGPEGNAGVTLNVLNFMAVCTDNPTIVGSADRLMLPARLGPISGFMA